MILCQISDLHITAERKRVFGKVDTAAALERCIARICSLQPRPDVVLITGDLVNGGSLAEYRALRALLDTLPVPYYLLVGNHDHRDSLREVFDEHDYLHQHPEFIQYALDLGPLRLIALDTLHPGHGSGMLCQRRLAWLDKALDHAEERPIVLAMHHPPFPTGIAHMDAIGLDAQSARAFGLRVSTRPHIERILCGHLHRPIQARFAGTLASTCPSPAHQIALDLDPAATSSYRMEPGSFQLHIWQPGLGLVSHLACIEEAPGPFPLFDPATDMAD